MSTKFINVMLAFSLLAIISCSSKENKDLVEKDAAINVTVSKPSSNNNNSIDVSGQVEAGTSANISTKVMGYITKMNVKVGDNVSRGQLLVTINSDDIAAKKAQTNSMVIEAEAAYKSAQKDLERFTNLYKQQSASAKELDNITLQYNIAKSRVESAKQMSNEVSSLFNYTNLTAPFSGTITQKNAEAGSMATPGMPLLILEQKGSYQISVAVPENAIAQVHQNADATVSIGSINKILKGRVTQINQSSSFTGGQYIVKIGISEADKNGLYAGMYANVSIPIISKEKVQNTSDIVLVPKSSIENKNELTGIYTISSNNTALLRWVRLGKSFGDKVEIISGLDKNEEFIIHADGKLYNGVPIKIK